MGVNYKSDLGYHSLPFSDGAHLIKAVISLHC